MRYLLSLVLVVCFALPALAEVALTPMQVEAIPFDNSRVASPNTDIITEEIDTQVTHDEKKAGLPQFDTSTFASQIFWLFVTFIILYLYFAKNALPKLSSAIENRRATIRKDLEQADALSSDIDKTRDDYEAAMADAHNNARNTIADTQDELRLEADSQSAAFKTKTDETITDFEKKAEAAKANIRSELNDIAATLTQDIISKISDLDVKDADINTAVDYYSDNAASSNKTKKAA